MEKTDKIYAQLIVDFVNITKPEKALLKLLENTERVFGFNAGFAKNQMILLERISKYHRENSLRGIGEAQQSLKSLLDGIIRGLNLYDSLQLRRYFYIYDKYCRPLFNIQKDGILREIVPFTERDFLSSRDHFIRGDHMIEVPEEIMRPDERLIGRPGYSIPEIHVVEKQIAYCVIQFFKKDKNIKLIHVCKNCSDYYVSKTIRHSKFCSDKCRMAWNNRKRIKSGAAKEYKRKKRREGAKESYYG